MFDPVLLMFPKENLKELNRRLRHYYTFHPIVRNIINLHSTFPFSDTEIRCEDKEIEAYWQYLGDKIDINKLITEMSHDYELLGECHLPGTKVLLSNKKFKNVESIKIGDKVYNKDGEVSVVKYRTSKKINESVVGLSIVKGKYTWMTEDHPVLVLKKDGFKWHENFLENIVDITFVKAGEIKKGDFVLYPSNIDILPMLGIVGVIGKYLILPVENVRRKHYEGKVYSMELQGDPTYIIDNMMIVHNSFHIGNFNEEDLEWENFVQYPPENIEVHKTYVGAGVAYEVKIDEELSKYAKSTKEIDRAVFNMLPTDLKESILNNKPIVIDNNRVLHHCNKPSGYLVRGESPLKAALKYLLLEDRLYMLSMMIVDRHMFPIKIWKIGSKEQKWIPSKKHFDMLKQQLIEMSSDPDYNLIYHAFIDLDIKNPSSAHEELTKWWEWTQKRILIALAANEAMFAEANPYAKDAVSIKLIMHRYMIQRSSVQRLLKRKVWLPVAIKRNLLYKNNSELAKNVVDDKYYIPKTERYILPKILWQPTDLVNNMAEKEFIYKLRKDGEVPASVLLDALGLDIDKVKKGLHEEESTILDPLVKKAKDDSLKDEKVKNGVIQGKKVADILTAIPEEEEKSKESTEEKPGPGRPSLPEELKKKPEPAIIPNEVMSPREKLMEKGELPTPKWEPPIPE
jgi:hypothetical protein